MLHDEPCLWPQEGCSCPVTPRDAHHRDGSRSGQPVADPDVRRQNTDLQCRNTELVERNRELAARLDFRQLQRETKEWATRNFGINRPPFQAVLGISEEAGELAHATLKKIQRIRGTTAEHDAAAQDAIGDIVIFALDFCNLSEFDFEKCVRNAWSRVRRRDWVTHPQDADQHVTMDLNETVTTETYGKA